MDHDSQDKSLDDVLSLMEKSYDNSEKPWDALKDSENQDICHDLMDARFLLHKYEAAKDIDVQAELNRFKEKQNKKKYKKMLWVWSSSVAAILAGVFFTLNAIFDTLIPLFPILYFFLDDILLSIKKALLLLR